MVSPDAASRTTMKPFLVGVLSPWAPIPGRPDSGYPILHVFAEFMLGMSAMYIANRVYSRSSGGSHA
jgi:hypothetical protein